MTDFEEAGGLFDTNGLALRPPIHPKTRKKEDFVNGKDHGGIALCTGAIGWHFCPRDSLNVIINQPTSLFFVSSLPPSRHCRHRGTAAIDSPPLCTVANTRRREKGCGALSALGENVLLTVGLDGLTREHRTESNNTLAGQLGRPSQAMKFFVKGGSSGGAWSPPHLSVDYTGDKKFHGLGVADRAGLERVCCSFTRVRWSAHRAVPHSCTSSGQQNVFPEGGESATTLLSSSGVCHRTEWR